MDNLDDYILSVQNYKKGIYEFEIVSPLREIKKAIETGIPEDIKQAVFSGKKFVCIEDGSVGLFVLGAFLILVWVFYEFLIQFLFSILSLPLNIITSLGSVGMFFVFVGLGLYSIGIELLILRKPFIVLGTEGIVYKLRTGDIKGFKWEDVSMDFFDFLDRYGQYKNLCQITFPNDSLIKIGTKRFYKSNQFPPKKQLGIGHSSRLLFLTFYTYYHHGKDRTFKTSNQLIDEDVKSMADNKSLSESTKDYDNSNRKELHESTSHLINIGSKNDENTFLVELKEAYKNYKNKNYTFGKYKTTEQIQIAHANGKIFVLKGGNSLIWVFFITMLILSVLWFVSLILAVFSELSETLIIVSILALSTIGFFTVVPCIILGLFTRMFLVIGPSGVYYRRIIKTGYIQWRNVTVVEERIETIKPRIRDPPVKTAQVSIILNNGEKVKFASIGYRSKEFARNYKRLLFLSLFEIYFELGKT